ncbi:hypothetical protein BDR03DRAFT_882515 [Suillus americanus]|nr:hypothetical protein BDR03DRAFT_882515 [Suillus americanus]
MPHALSFLFYIYHYLTQQKERKQASTIHALAEELDVPNLPRLVRLFLYDQLLADDEHTSDTVLLTACPRFQG